jgi:hypothetical protein
MIARLRLHMSTLTQIVSLAANSGEEIVNSFISPYSNCIFRPIATTIPIDREQCSDSSRTAFCLMGTAFRGIPRKALREINTYVRQRLIVISLAAVSAHSVHLKERSFIRNLRGWG